MNLSRPELVSTFANKPPEVHAAAAGAAAGGFLGLAWQTGLHEVALAGAAAVLLCALGIKQLSNRKLGAEIKAEAQYALGALVVAFVLGFVVNQVFL